MRIPALFCACLGALFLALALCLCAPVAPARADTAAAGTDSDTDEDADADAARPGFHFSATAGWYGALTGPSPHGPAAELEILPGGIFGHLGAGAYYRGHERLERGLVALGLVYEVGAARPRLTMSLHADVGYDLASELPVVGAGVRSCLGVTGPLVVSSDLTAHMFLDGIDSRLGFALTLSAGFAD